MQALVSKLGTTASLTETLLTNTAILSDPTQPATSPLPLLAAFQAAGDDGVTVTYYSDAAESVSVGSATVATASTDKNTNPTSGKCQQRAFRGIHRVSRGRPLQVHG